MPCPDCHRECLYQEPEPRVLQSRRGEVTWLEGKFYCHHCRRNLTVQKEHGAGNPFLQATEAVTISFGS